MLSKQKLLVVEATRVSGQKEVDKAIEQFEKKNGAGWKISSFSASVASGNVPSSGALSNITVVTILLEKT